MAETDNKREHELTLEQKKELLDKLYERGIHEFISFNQAYDQFIDRQEYDKLMNTISHTVKLAFKAGWMSAWGQAPPRQRPHPAPPEEIPTDIYLTQELFDRLTAIEQA